MRLDRKRLVEALKKGKRKLVPLGIGLSMGAPAAFAQTMDMSGVTQTITEVVPVLITLAVVSAILGALKKFGKL